MANFKVDPRLATLLGEGYRSSEYALKELIDNAWDADAENVWVTLPAAMTDQPIIVRDDGTGMTEAEVSNEYLVVANDRFTRKGSHTASKRRRVKGRKGIGKLAGFVMANEMRLETSVRGVKTVILIPKQKLLEAADFEKFDLPVETHQCDESFHGTEIVLSKLNQELNFPTPEKLRELLVYEYSRESDFHVFVNNVRVSSEDIKGEQVTHKEHVEGIGDIEIRYTIAEMGRKRKDPGLIMRVGGKVVGAPSLLGLNEDEDVPQGVARRVFGEIIADGLEQGVTGDWGAIIENYKPFQVVKEKAVKQLKAKLKQTFHREFNLQKGRLKLSYQRQLESLPEMRREVAKRAIDKVLRRFSGDLPDSKLETIIQVVLEALERDEYLTVLEAIETAPRSDVVAFAEALDSFGLTDIAHIVRQATVRMRFLDQLDVLIANPKTLEKEVHHALERNLWVLGNDYSLIFSNKTLQSQLDSFLDEREIGQRGKNRPDLFLGQGVDAKYTLIEFKRPSHSLTRDDESQAVKYRDDLSRKFGQIQIVVLGEKVSPAITTQYQAAGILLRSYADVVSSARSQLSWLVGQLRDRVEIAG